ncbi:MAG: hypothetical protein AAF438_06960 [Pseudomonadota bacterium]
MMAVTSPYKFIGLVAALLLGLACSNDAPDSVAGYVENARTLILQKQTSLAISMINRGIQSYPQNSELRQLLAEVLLSTGDAVRAEAAALKALETGATVSGVYPLLAKSLLLQERPREVLNLLQDCSQLSEEMADCLLMVARARLDLNVDKLTLDAFIRVYKHVEVESAEGKHIVLQLEDLAKSHGIVAGARQHMRCNRETPQYASKPLPLPNSYLHVGPGRELILPSQAAAIAKDGDTIVIDAAEYTDVAIWRANDLTIRGLGGRPIVRSAALAAEDKGIWVIKGDNTTVAFVELVGARSTHRNGSGIRLEGNNLTIVESVFRDNENGLLTAKRPASSIEIRHSEFANNGYGDGYSHNIYVGVSKSFTIIGSTSHSAKVGHQIKSRAKTNAILGNFLADRSGGNSSYLIDLPNGGSGFVVGNILHQGLNALNRTMLSYSAENQSDGDLHIYHNTFYSQQDQTIFVRNHSSNIVHVANNLFGGARGIRLEGEGLLGSNYVSLGADFIDPENLDFRLTADSGAIDAAEVLRDYDSEILQYVEGGGARIRPEIWLPDMGALEFCGH